MSGAVPQPRAPAPSDAGVTLAPAREKAREGHRMTGEQLWGIHVEYLRGGSIDGLAAAIGSRTPQSAGSYAKGGSR